MHSPEKNLLFNLNFHLSNKLKIGVFTSYNQFSTDFDGTDYDPVTYEGTPADRDNTLKSAQKRFGVHADYKYAKGMLKVRTFFTGIQRNETPSEDYFKGEVYGLDVFNNYKINSKYSFLVGFTAQSQDMQQQTAYSAIEKGSGKQHFYDPYVSFNYSSSFGFI